MSKFSVIAVNYKFEMFKSTPIYMITDTKTDEQFGRPFDNFSIATYICKWLNDTEEEVNDYYESKLGGQDDL